MKKFTLLLYFIAITLASCVQSHNINIENLYYAGKIWGLLKYHHPSVAAGNYDWDEKLDELLNDVATLDNTRKRDKIFCSFINSLGEIKSVDKIDFNDDSKYSQAPDYSWVNSSNLSSKLVAKINSVIFCERDVDNHYLDPDNYGIFPGCSTNEKIYTDFDYSDMNNRLLYLFRYWNLVEYFFAYKNIADNNWDDMLKEYIPLFVEAKTEEEVHNLTAKLMTETNDSHSYALRGTHKYYSQVQKKYTVPLQLKVIDDKIVAHKYLDKHIEHSKVGDEILAGDVIIEVDNVLVEELKKIREEYYSMSNYNSDNNITLKMLASDNQNFKIKVLRDNKELILNVIGIDSNKLDQFLNDEDKFIMHGDVLYANACKFKIEDLSEFAKYLSTAKGLVLDLRGYPWGTFEYVSMMISPNSAPYCKFSKTSLKQPGLFTYKDTSYTPRGSISSNYYKGDIVLLVNESSISHSEFTAMMWQAAPNVTTIGSRTAGADGNVFKIIMPDGNNLFFTGIGVYYPDGGETQRVGIRIDEVIKPTIKGIKEGRDEVLERAIEIINTKQ